MNVAGIRLRNPLILCSGVLGIATPLFSRLEKNGVGAIVTKSISLCPNTGYEAPTVTDVAGGILNAMGLPNPGVDAFIEEIRDSDLSVPLIVSIYGKDAKEYAEMAQKISPYCDAIEMNLSCPHAGGLLAIGQNEGLVREVVSRTKEAAEVPGIAKLTPNVTDITAIGRAAQEGGADAVSAINTVRGMAINIHQEHPVLSNISGGLSGPAIKPIGVKCVWDLAGALDIPIIGIGGISSWEDVIEYMMAGASAVQLGTVLGSQGISHLNTIAKGIEQWCRANELDIEAVTGLVRDRF
jgi:dihydroorotate dehydrogenase (NAD+) catalytic subunit